MNGISTTFRTLSAALDIPRLLAILALALALVAIPAFSPDGVDARRMSERSVSRACAGAGGSVHYDFHTGDFSDFSMTCTLPSGNSFTCGSTGGPFGGIVDC
ncbi:MAG TPA: hypothetical protein VD767_02650 [Thermomicrobiales bacterium]|nr:hypothetical protein [Thermomicrobiales bacterium]